MTFSSILFPDTEDGASPEPGNDPPFFADLNLDLVADAIFAGREGYDLRPFFRVPLRGVDAIAYRHEVIRDIEHEQLYHCLVAFAASMRTIREALATTRRLHYTLERERWVVDASTRYCEAIDALAHGLEAEPIVSRGFSAFRKYLAGYRGSEGFRDLVNDISAVRDGLASITYAVLVNVDRFTVRDPQGEPDLVAAVHETFARFRRGAAKSYLLSFREQPGMNHIEAKVLEFVARLHPEAFAELDRFANEHTEFIDPVIERFDREVQFYLAALEYARAFEDAGLAMCLPRVETLSKSVMAEETFDVALARRLIGTPATVVRNDFALNGTERVFVVSGPNQGGKTTFARTFGQLHYMAALGCPVAGRAATTYLFDAMFTHFERQEDPLAQHGKLENDVLRIHTILETATPASVIILNEIFSSTTVRDAGILARSVMEQILDLDALCVCVTFIDELSTLSEKTVSVVSLVDEDNPDLRTFKLARRAADGLAYAVALAEKYSLTYGQLIRRLDKERP